MYNHLIHILKAMQGFPETIITLFVIITWGNINELVSSIVLLLAFFYWVLQIKRLVQERYYNSFWGAVKSLFRKKNKYGEK